jgi:hypothetical protein
VTNDVIDRKVNLNILGRVFNRPNKDKRISKVIVNVTSLIRQEVKEFIFESLGFETVELQADHFIYQI